MLHITDRQIDTLIDASSAQDVVRDAFLHFDHGNAATQARERIQANGVKLSTMGAVIPGQEFAGAKVYTTIAGQFNFVILLFSTIDGRPLATLEANAITRLRTAASSVVAARYLARPDSRRMMLYGAGIQGQAHAYQFSKAYPLESIAVFDPYASDDVLRSIEKTCNVSVTRCTDHAPIEDADLIVTASRSREPLFDGNRVRPGTYIAAIGSSLPDTRELDDRLLARASTIAVEWKPQSLVEAGDFVLADPGLSIQERVVELGALINGATYGRSHHDDITIYKAVGIGLEDIALAGLAYQRLIANS